MQINVLLGQKWNMQAFCNMMTHSTGILLRQRLPTNPKDFCAYGES